jgi:hypothetical protein
MSNEINDNNVGVSLGDENPRIRCVLGALNSCPGPVESSHLSVAA